MIVRWTMQSDSNKSWTTLRYDEEKISDGAMINKDGEEAVVVYREDFEDKCIITLIPAERRKINKDYKGRVIKSDVIDKGRYFFIVKSFLDSNEYVSRFSYSIEEIYQIIRTYSTFSFEKAVFFATKKGIILDQIDKDNLID
ncbi:hypothetical protein [Methylobacterium indicum]|uniref:hypothetical protein n=1 Tax=Methylobacterium indicum TaxID=1775910 RepID=UPI000A976589|nr:hypothetical protein [Methylobacterium indicum]